MDTWYIDSWQHLMGALDAVLDDARSNAAALTEPHPAIDRLLSAAAAQRAAAAAELRELDTRRSKLAGTLDELQRELAVAGVPLRGEAS